MTRANEMNTPLNGLTVLIIEDDFLIGMMLLKEIERAGATVVGPVSFVADALKEIGSGLSDVAILDGKLADGSAADLADALERQGMRYVVVSGYEQENLPTSLKGAPFVSKPVTIPLLIEALRHATRRPPVPTASADAPNPGRDGPRPAPHGDPVHPAGRADGSCCADG